MNALNANIIARFTNVKHATCCALVFLVGSSISLQAEPPQRSILSKSRQYTISSTLVQPQPVPPGKTQPIPDRIYLSPYKLAHFAGAVKDQVLRQLQLPPREQWIGRIHLNIVPGKLGDPIIFERKRFINRWQYRLDLPEVMNGRELAQAIVAVQLEEYAAAHTKGVASVKTHVLYGTIYDQIIKVANECGADLIVMGSHRPALEDYLIGPNAARVMRHAKQSVFIVRD